MGLQRIQIVSHRIVAFLLPSAWRSGPFPSGIAPHEIQGPKGTRPPHNIALVLQHSAFPLGWNQNPFENNNHNPHIFFSSGILLHAQCK